ncbi:uncharacterized protein [Venturia canescens]|uniref:uncharacterized protein n=1 Tax=Venturia canescens TaxID=32260 RepID=UPI001C9BD7A7|nr:uncharacterized protein LOC122417536 [Venturia canescens]
MAEGGGATDSKPNSDNPAVLKSQTEINECLGTWLSYLQMLNGLCSAGTKLAQTLQSLLSNHETVVHYRLSSQCLAGWEELSRATGVASNTVKHRVVAALRDHENRENDTDKQDILRDNLMTFINLQYQFCVACCECLGGMAECSCPRTGKTECDIAALQQCSERLYSSPTPLSSGSIQQNSHRSPLPFPLFPLQVQRRWSETAAAEMSGDTTESTMRRWSMPWDCRHVSEWPCQESSSVRLRVPPRNADRSRSITPDSAPKSSTITTSQDGLQEAIQLLSCRPGIRASNQQSAFVTQHIPGVTLTTCNFDGNFENSVWPETRASIGSGSSRCWPAQHSHTSDHSDLSGHRDNCEHSANSGDHRDSEQIGDGGCGGSVGSGHRDSKDSIHSHHSDHNCQKECESAMLDLLPSRKNSSSTDSCLSANSRSGSESACTGEVPRSQLYSMWSGGDMPFIRLPESNEVQDDRSSAN